jgi:streptothricin acetyltransferase
MFSIHELDESNVASVNQGDGRFIVEAKLCLYAENGQIGYTIVSVPAYEKRYAHDDIDYTTYIGHPDKTIFFAYVDEQLAGQIILRKNWNNYAYIEDIVVDARFRQQGIGRALITRAIQWAKAKNLPGIMLETQNNNVAGCKLYESCGFQLGGFDRYLYRGITPDTDEIALYWYLVFGVEES